MFWKKKKAAQKLLLGLDIRRCAECEQVLRPCEVDGMSCLFHRFVDEEKAHPSETALDHTRPDWAVYNAGSLADLRCAVRLWVEGKFFTP